MADLKKSEAHFPQLPQKKQVLLLFISPSPPTKNIYILSSIYPPSFKNCAKAMIIESIFIFWFSQNISVPVIFTKGNVKGLNNDIFEKENIL